MAAVGDPRLSASPPPKVLLAAQKTAIYGKDVEELADALAGNQAAASKRIIQHVSPSSQESYYDWVCPRY